MVGAGDSGLVGRRRVSIRRCTSKSVTDSPRATAAKRFELGLQSGRQWVVQVGAMGRDHNQRDSSDPLSGLVWHLRE